MSGAAIAGTIIQGVSELGKLGYSIYQDQRDSKFSREQFDYQKALNQQVMDREDTALQRRVADAEAAGISKYAVAGQGASATGLSTFGGSMGSQRLPDAKLDFANHLLQLKEQEARTKLAQSEYNFYKDTMPDRKARIALDNLAVGASTRRTESETAGIDVENLIRGRRNLLDATEYNWLTADGNKNFRDRLAADLLGLQYSTESKGYERNMLKRKDFLDFTYGMDERSRSYRQGERADELDNLRYQWLLSQGEDGMSNLVKSLLIEQLDKEGKAIKSSKEGQAVELDVAGNFLKSLLPFLMYSLFR